MLFQACEKGGPRAGCDRQVGDVEGQYHIREIVEQLVTSFKLQLLGSLGRTGCTPHSKHHRWQHVSSGWKRPLDSMEAIDPSASRELLAGDPVERNQGAVDGDNVKSCVGW